MVFVFTGNENDGIEQLSSLAGLVPDIFQPNVNYYGFINGDAEIRQRIDVQQCTYYIPCSGSFCGCYHLVFVSIIYVSCMNNH
jgi:hypothetical protein